MTPYTHRWPQFPRPADWSWRVRERRQTGINWPGLVLMLAVAWSAFGVGTIAVYGIMGADRPACACLDRLTTP